MAMPRGFYCSVGIPRETQSGIDRCDLGVATLSISALDFLCAYKKYITETHCDLQSGVRSLGSVHNERRERGAYKRDPQKPAY